MIELKLILFLLSAISGVSAFFCYEEKWVERKKYFGFIEINEGYSISGKWWFLFLTCIFLFSCALCLNEEKTIMLF